jgi:glycosyltransferase involved in cell wall biosynthesis
MTGLAYLFERFPSFTQTFCYREIAELRRQSVYPAIYSVRRPTDEPGQSWDHAIIREVEYLPGEEQLIRGFDQARRKKQLPVAAVDQIEAWGRKTDFLRLYQAAWLGPRLQARGITHLHAHFAGLAARTAWWVERFFGIGFSFTAHANDIFAPKPFEVSLGRLIEGARAIVTVSEFGVCYLREKFPGQGGKIWRVYNGVELERFPAADFNPPVPVVISVGRLIEKKGFGDLIEACRVLRDRGYDFRCEIIGDGPLEQELRGRIESAGLTSVVALAGPLPQEEVIARLARSRVFALPCVSEAGGGMDNLPTVIMEAMAAGLPVVSTPLGGVPEMVEEGVTGLLSGEHEPAALADSLGRLLGNREFAQSLGQAGRRRAAECFAIEQSGRALIKLFRDLGAS